MKMGNFNIQKLLGLISAICLTIAFFGFVNSYVYAGELPQIPEADLFAKIAELILNWGSMSSIAKGSVTVIILTQVMKQVSDFKYKNLLVAFFSVAYAVFQMIASGVPLMGSVVSVLFTSGGAILLYNALKPFLKSVKALSFLDLGKRE